ncbi:2-acyl-glycerophospho-ethanolamine acyltransferase [Sphingobacterium spiritivorum]|uniref:2-acyl-glycerophospho-ethanolamine acyltransferase n=2 Tax=Sphingobacterium spiritivorum TaxID=258 RepID=A0A380BSB0_SPHSI|nr:2-acyl-glycerophospho-ethanolamine acyltransferase [Sphingobacterium spiritivorum]
MFNNKSFIIFGSMVRIWKKAHRICYFSSVLFFFILFFPVLYFFTRKPLKYYHQIACCRKWISLLSAYCVGIRFRTVYEVPIDWSKTYILCANHTSVLDITTLSHICHQSFSFLGKAELLKNPVTRIFFKTIDIPVDRKSKIASFRAFKKATQNLQVGKSIVIFPEGRIDDSYPPVLHKFKSGPFRMAIENNIPIIPIVVHNAWDIFWDDGRRNGSKPGKIYSTVLAPVSPEGYTEENLEDFQELIYEKMKSYWEIKKLS